jgi:F0F1-type ATP synthase membrane subunit c/vacuolar-type H+-ATPase subunit K
MATKALVARTRSLLAEPTIRWRCDRAFFIGMALAIIAENVVLFTISFLKTDIADELHSTWVKIHTAAFASWLLLFLTQATLITLRRPDIHRRMGIAGALLAALMIGLTIGSGISAFVRSPPRPLVDHLFLHVSVHVEMFIFTGFVTAALLNRGNPEVHKRLMLLATMAVGLRFPPPLVRILFHITLHHYWEQVFYVLIAMLYDYISRERINRVYIWGIIAFLIVAPGVEWTFRTVVPHLVAPPKS